MKADYFAVSSGRVREQYDRSIRKVSRNGAMARIMSRDATVFTRRKAEQEEIANRLGWVDIAGKMRQQATHLESFAKDIVRAGFKHVVVMGMGGSSLCPDLLGRVFGGHPRLATYDVIDSTAPRAIKAVRRKLNLNKTLFVVSSKSGTTVETRSQMNYFYGELERAGFTRPGRQFVAITDRGSALYDLARGDDFRKIYSNPDDIGGRYSALSYFGLVPAMFAGAEIADLLDDAVAMETLIRERQGETNPALVLGTLMAAAAAGGVDKLTFAASKTMAPLVPWIEQLVAESTGKNGVGIIPVDAEALGDAGDYHTDRLFVTMRLNSEKPPMPPELKTRLKRKGFPFVEIRLSSTAQLGGQFLLWEAATALAGYHLGMNPFDEPNVTESKKNTTRILDHYRESGQFADVTPAARYKHLSLLTYGGGRKRYQLSEIANLKKLLTRFLSGVKKPQYISFLSYLKEDRAVDKVISDMRTALRSKYRVATLRGYGPRYLHSVGQLYKGGPATGRFIVFVQADYENLDIPGRFYDFGQLITAQAIGDARALLDRDLPTLVFALEGSAAKGLKEFADVLDAICK